jgi:hypothetical protein
MRPYLASTTGPALAVLTSPNATREPCLVAVASRLGWAGWAGSRYAAGVTCKNNEAGHAVSRVAVQLSRTSQMPDIPGRRPASAAASETSGQPARMFGEMREV